MFNEPTSFLLSIHIPYTYERQNEADALSNELYVQIVRGGYAGIVEVISDNTGKEMTIGEKRNVLYNKSKGIWSVQWDSDDWVHPQGLKLIIEALQNNPDVDCCTYEEYIDIDGKIQRSNHSLKYSDWCDNFDGFDYCRTPFMKSVIKTEIAKSIPVPFERFAEDHLWSKELKKVLQTEVHIDEQIYRYIHRSSNFNERYGIKD